MARYSQNLIWIPIEKLKPYPLNERLFGKPTEKEMEAFVESFKEVGQIEVIIVMENGDGTYTILSGHQRVEAAKRAGQKKVAARIFYPDYEGEERKIVIHSNIIRKNIPYTHLNEISEALATCKPPELLKKKLIPELAQLVDSNEVSLSVLSLIAECSPERQREFVSLIEIHKRLTGGKRMEMEDFERMKQAEEEIREENPELKEELEKLKQDLFIKEHLILKLKKELAAEQELHGSAMKELREMRNEVRKLYDELEKAKEEGRKEAEEKLKKELEEVREKIKSKEEELEEAKVEMIALKHKIEEQKKEITGLKHLDKIYREKVEEIKERLKRQVEEKMREVARKKQELVSERFREEVFSFYKMNPGLSDQLREVYKWFVAHEYQFKATEAFLAETRQKIKILFAPENYPAQTLPDEIVELKRKWIALLDHLAKAAEETADLAAKAHPN